eukprot:gene27981-biopygen5927
MISENISHDTIVLDKEKYGSLPGVEYVEISTNGTQVCRFAQSRKGVLPCILEALLQLRKQTRHVRVSDAATNETVFVGQKKDWEKKKLELEDAKNYKIEPAYTNSSALFWMGEVERYKTTAKLLLRSDGRDRTILCTFAIIVWRLHHAMDAHHDHDVRGRPSSTKSRTMEYEKTLFPLILLSKKRYVGLLYENDPDEPAPKQKSMGIALKRRDYAQVVKRVYGGVIDIVLTRRDVPAAVSFLRDRLRELAAGRTPLEELVISKTLKSHYKFPAQIAHAVLARRMYERDPGSAPQKVRIDAKMYIENQLMKPCTQLLAIALEQIPGYTYRVAPLWRRALSTSLIRERD